jgi:hypothetical protein
MTESMQTHDKSIRRLKPVSGTSLFSSVVNLRFFTFFVARSEPPLLSSSLSLSVAALLILPLLADAALPFVIVRVCPLRLDLGKLFSCACRALAYDSSSGALDTFAVLGFVSRLGTASSANSRFTCGASSTGGLGGLTRMSLKISAI